MNVDMDVVLYFLHFLLTGFLLKELTLYSERDLTRKEWISSTPLFIPESESQVCKRQSGQRLV